MDHGMGTTCQHAASEKNSTSSIIDQKRKTDWCAVCHCGLEIPFIRCFECEGQLYLCASCFSNGRETGGHKSHHAYTVISDRFPLFDNSWEARDEVRLLDLLLECGYGNWHAIGRRLGRDPKECQEHYDSLYLKRPPPELKMCQPELPFLPSTLPFYKVKVPNENPPREHPSLPGYNALRGEFDVDHDGNRPELDLSMVSLLDYFDNDPENTEFMQSLQVAMVEVFNDHLRERARRRQIVRTHGLLMARKNYMVMTRYSSTLGRSVISSLVSFSQLLTAAQFDFFLEGLLVSFELGERIKRLREYRMLGLRSFYSVGLMRRMQRLREKQKDERRKLQFKPNFGLPTEFSPGELAGAPRRVAPPLKVSGLPMYERLEPVEQELCANARIVPESYLEFKRILTVECSRSNGLKLAQARKAIKIDVNKTRKLFDFLMKNGYIFPPPSSKSKS